ncbi:MAG: hypothetical protein JSV41_05960 [Gemmatimonadota bacterium]|nr:MAG: hypothetical protein JSV41_05960 [Gemmatimonadota bacterium]
MSTNPTPFIGGTESPRQDPSTRDKFAPPYVAGADESPAEGVTPPDLGMESPEEALEPTQAEAGAAEAPPPVEVEALEPEAPEIEVPVQWVDAEAEAIFTEEAPAELEELVLSEEGVAEAAPPGGPPPEAQEPAAAEAEPGIPDFLFGPDGGGPEIPIQEPEQAAVLGESLERLAAEAERLLQGEEGERIRALIADLGRHGADIAVARAFAAGYLAAKRREES